MVKSAGLRSRRLYLYFFAFTLCLTLSLNAQAAKKKKAKNSAQPSSGRTVGDMLKNIEKKSEKVNFKKSSIALPTAQGSAQAPKTAVNLKAVKPPSSRSLFYDKDSDEAELERVTDEQIAQLYDLTRKYTKSTKRGELWLRLAELYAEKARLIEFKVMTKYDDDLRKFSTGKLKKRPKIDLAESNVYNRKAIQLYEWFLRDFPKDSKVDQALFFLGFNYFELNETKKGQQYYLRLTKEFPRSDYVGESNFALGEFYFESEQWKAALGHYTSVAMRKSHRLYSFALYKMAWCNYKLNNSKTGLKYLEQVILEGRRSKGEKDSSLGGVSRIKLASEAIKDLIVFFAEAGSHTRARPYFEEVVGEKGANANLEKLAYFYLDTGNRAAAKFIFKDLISQDVNAVKAFDYQYAIVNMYGALSIHSEFKTELYAWIDEYGPSSNWQKVNSKNKEAVKKANEIMEQLLRNHVLQLHQIAQNSKTKTSQAAEKSAYTLFFNTFKDGDKIDEIHFFYGELLFDMADYEKAAGHYIWVVDNAPKSQYYDKALINSLLAFEKRLPTDSQIKKIVGENSNAIAFTEPIQAFEAAAFRFLEKAPNSENVVAVKYRLGALYYLFNQFNKAEPALREIIKKYPKTPYAKFAANHLLDIYNLKKDYAGLQQAANDILAVPEMAKSDIGTQIKDIKLKTDFKLAKELEDKKDYEGSAKAYEGFASRNPKSDLATGALFNAAVNYERSGHILKAVGLYAVVSKRKSPQTKQFSDNSNKFLPVLYEKIGQYALAASLFQNYARTYPKDSVSLGYLYNAAIIYDGLNFYTNAINNYEEYFKLSRAKDRFEVLFLLAKIYERRRQYDMAVAQYDKYTKSGTTNRPGIIESYYNIAKIHERLRRKTVAEEWFKKTVFIQRKFSSQPKGMGAAYAAEAKFKLVYKTYEELTAIRIPTNPANQNEAIKKKLGLTNRLKDELKSVVAYDDGFQIVAALSTQGQALHHMYTSILNAPKPKGLKPEELKQYDEGIQGIANPFRDQAIEIYKTAIDRGQELQGYNDFLLTAQKNLGILTNKLNPAIDGMALSVKELDGLDL